MKRSSDHDEVTAAYIQAKAQIAALPLVKDAQGDKAKYLRLGTLLAAIEPILLEQGCALVQGCAGDCIQDGVLCAMRIETTLLHVSGQWMRTSVLIPVAGAQKKSTDGGGFYPPNQQSGGITITYGRRYGIFAFFCLAVDEDTDGATKNRGRRARAKELAEEIAVKTDDRLTRLREKLNNDRITDPKEAARIAAETDGKQKDAPTTR